MADIVLDFETRSTCDLRRVGSWGYAADPATQVMCLALRFPGQPAPELWVPECWRPKLKGRVALVTDERLDTLLREPGHTYHAYNAGFEYGMWYWHMAKRYGFPMLHLNRWSCLHARAMMLGLPARLDDAAKALGLVDRKDETGARVMMRMCKPDVKGNWVEDEANFETLCRYCRQDVVVEEAMHRALPPIPVAERDVWRADQMINLLGIPVDVEGCRNVVARLAESVTRMKAEFRELTRGHVESPTQRAKLLLWLAEAYELELPDLTKTTVSDQLRTVEDTGLRRVLEIRAELSKASNAKYTAALKAVGDDHRIHNAFVYHGASTGRWSGKGVQPQNMLRYDADPEDMDRFFEAAKTPELFFALYGDAPGFWASRYSRGMFLAPEGSVFIPCDLAAIEGRVLAWLAGETRVLDMYRAGEDIYVANAMRAYGKPKDRVTSKDRMAGKVMELALGYQGGVGALERFGAGYGLSWTEKEGRALVNAWRNSRPKTRQLWYDTENAAREAVSSRGASCAAGPLVYTLRTTPGGLPVLLCRLPSGRALYYLRPRLVEDRLVYDGTRQDEAGSKRSWGPVDTYGGKLVENATQAVARDVLVYGMLGVMDDKIKVPIHVHDELVPECPEAEAELVKATVERRMTAPPPWAVGLPLAAKAFVTRRYRKD